MITLQKKTETENKPTELDECKLALEKSKALVSEYTDHLKRLQAEFENYVKRVEKERADVSARTSERLIVRLLLVVDDFERALNQLKEVPAETKKGIELIFKNLHKMLAEEKVEPIHCVGKTIDPYHHEVLMQVESEAPEGEIIEELQKGYKMNGRVIRYAKVKVSKGPKEKNETKTLSCPICSKRAGSGEQFAHDHICKLEETKK